MSAQLDELARLVSGDVIGDRHTLITGAATLDDAGAGAITLIDSVNRMARLDESLAAAAVVPRGAGQGPLPMIEVDDVHAAFTRIVIHFRPVRAPAGRCGVSRGAIVSATARIADDVDVHPGAVIGDEVEIGAGAVIHSGAQVMAGSKLGAGVTLYPNAVLYEDTIVGPRTVIHSGAVIGAFGFGYSLVEGRHQLSAQLGHVEIGADVEIGAGATVDRGTYGPTVIGEGTKIDNQVMIAHNCRIGKHNMICSQVGIAGSTSTGDYVVMAGQVGVRDHVHIGSRAVLSAMAGVTNDVPDGARMMGIPATPDREQKLKLAALTKLPEMRKQLKQLRATVAELTQRLETLGKNAA